MGRDLRRRALLRSANSSVSHRVITLLGLAALALVPQQALAKCDFDWGSTMGTYSVSVPPTMVNDPNTPVGSVLYTSSPTPINHRVDFSCNGAGNAWGLVNNAGGPPASGQKLFPIGVTGVSYRVLQNGDYIGPYPSLPLGHKTSWIEEDPVTIELVKTGVIANGTVIAVPLAEFRAGKSSNYIVDAVIQLTNTLTFTAPACQVNASAINVTLPAVSRQGFSGVGSVAGTTPFQIGLTCSSGATLRMTLDTAAPVPGQTGVIAPSSGGASGIGVQVLDSSGVTPVSFGTATTIGATPNGALSIGYFARYYQTTSPVSAGAVNATATFTLSYQ
jgi:type 1 fimbria pilin